MSKVNAPLSAEREREIRVWAMQTQSASAEARMLRVSLLDALAALDHARAELAAASQPCADCGAPSPRAQSRPA